VKTFVAAAAVAVFGFVGSASAADMAVKAAPRALMYNWSGIYIGGAAGWQGSSIDLSSPPAGVLTYDPRHSSLALGAFLGAQRQFGQFVLGIEGGYLAAFREASLGSTPSVSIFFPGGTGTAQAKLRDIWSVGGRLGLAMGQWMPYLTGGYANGSFRFNAQSAGITEEARANNAGGYYIGGGVDWAFTRNWIIGVEYRHHDFSSKTVASNSSTGFSEPVRFDPRTDTVLARLSYKFDWGWR
jgi:outer membrane immunogenic protein